MRIGLCSSAFGALAVAAAMPVVAQAQSPAVQFRVPAGPLETTLPLFAAQSGEQILYSTDLVAGRQSPGVSGALRTDQALVATTCFRRVVVIGAGLGIIKHSRARGS